MSGTWSKGTSRGLLHGVVSEYWVSRLLKRRRDPASGGAWLPGDFVLLDIDTDGAFGRNLVLQDRELALVITFRYRWPDRPQADGSILKRWYDFLILKQKRRRGRGPGWRLVAGSWAGFSLGRPRRFEWQLYYGNRQWYAHRLAAHVSCAAFQ